MVRNTATEYARYRSLKAAVDQTIAPLLGQVEPGRLREAMSHGAYGGKRVRPLLTMFSCAAAGGAELDALDAATAVELLHTSSLVHDDIMDEADTRRGQATIHTLYGTSMGILAGDTFVALAFRLMQSVNSPNRERIMHKFTNAFLHVCEGQGYDVCLTSRSCSDPQCHSAMVEKKTAKLLEAAASIGAMIGSNNEDHIQALAKFGLHLGMAFQAKDDLLDAIGSPEQLGKPVRLDSRNGKATYISMVSPHLPTASANEESTSIETASGMVEEYTSSACMALDLLPPTQARDQLKLLADSLVSREA